MHIFCDESGGSNAASRLFLVVAVNIQNVDAGRLIKAFRKYARVSGEIKGNLLALPQRKVFFEVLTKETRMVSAAVTCSRTDALGAWAMGKFREPELYGWLLTEACHLLLPPASGIPHLTVTPDGGRYQRTVSDQLREDVTSRLCTAGCAERVTIGFDYSERWAGLQVADVIANTVFQSFDPTKSVEALLEPLYGLGKLRVQSLALEGARPSWLNEVTQKEKPPLGGFSKNVGGSS